MYYIKSERKSIKNLNTKLEYEPIFPSLDKVIKSERTIEVEKPLPTDKEDIISSDNAEFLDKI